MKLVDPDYRRAGVNPTYWDAMLDGERCVHDMRFASAISAFSRAAASSPRDWRAPFNEGVCRQRLEFAHTALTCYRRALQLVESEQDYAMISRAIQRATEELVPE